MRLASLLATSACILCLMGCSSSAVQGYDGPALSRDETALIRMRRPNRMRRVRSAEIVAIDTPVGAISVDTQAATLLPGETCIAVEARTISLHSASGYLCFDVRAGSSYEIQILTVVNEFPAFPDLYSNEEIGVAEFSLIDTTTGDTVVAVTP